MIFARRAIQRCLESLRSALGNDTVDPLVARLNRPGRDRLATMWEVVVLDALSRVGDVQSEVPLPSRRRPDIVFAGRDISFTADITTASDDGLDEQNPYDELSRLVEIEKTRLGFPIGGLDIQVASTHTKSARGEKTSLRLPTRARLRNFVQTAIVPKMVDHKRRGDSAFRISLDDNEAGLDITFNPSKSPYSYGGFAAYDIPGSKDRNPLFNAMKPKADQLRDAEGITGIVACDGDCEAFVDNMFNQRKVTSAVIAREFLRQYSSIDFVLLLTVRETRSSPWPVPPAVRRIHHTLVVRDGIGEVGRLKRLFDTVVQNLPNPVNMPANGAMRAREEGYGLGRIGGYQMDGNGKKLLVSSRELVEVLAGLRSFQDDGEKNSVAGRKPPRKPNPLQSAFLHNLMKGKLPTAVRVVPTGEDDSDDWIEFEFGDADPAISPFK